MDHEGLDGTAAEEDQAAFDRELAAYRARNITAFIDGTAPVGPFSADPAVLLLIDTRDVSSGETRSTLVFHFVDPSGIVAFGSHHTSDKAGWHDDVLAHPQATVHRWEGAELVRFDVLAHPVDASEAESLFPRVTEVQPAWAEYGSCQEFPLVRLERVGPVPPPQPATGAGRLRRMLGF